MITSGKWKLESVNEGMEDEHLEIIAVDEQEGLISSIATFPPEWEFPPGVVRANAERIMKGLELYNKLLLRLENSEG